MRMLPATGGNFRVNRLNGIKSDIQCSLRSRIMWGKEHMRQDEFCPSVIGGGGGGVWRILPMR